MIGLAKETKMKKGFVVALGIEILAIMMMGTGLGIELARGVDLGYVIFSAGCALAVAGSIIWVKLLKGS